MQKLSPLVETTIGKIQGTQDNDFFEFLGIPYASPPVGDLRWCATKEHKGWSGIRSCIVYGANAPQIINSDRQSINISEDCLYLNIWSPSLDENSLLPVMVWIHGGGFTSGSASSPLTAGKNLAKQNVVVISINYRLGIFGFFAHKGLNNSNANGYANFGLHDQIKALEWIKSNAKKFGGNPENITVFGVSAGAACIALLMNSPKCSGIFNKVILQSPGSYRALANLDQAQNSASEFYNSDIQILRSMNTCDLLKIQTLIDPPNRSLLQHRILRPIIDNDIIHHQEISIINQKKNNAFPMIIGNHHNEELFFPKITEKLNSLEDYLNLLTKDFGKWKDSLLELYPAKDRASSKLSYGELFADIQFNLASKEIADSNISKEIYTERYIINNLDNNHCKSTHTNEVEFIFKNMKNGNFININDKQHISNHWIDFAKKDSEKLNNSKKLKEYSASEGLLKSETISNWRVERFNLLKEILLETIKS